MSPQPRTRRKAPAPEPALDVELGPDGAELERLVESGTVTMDTEDAAHDRQRADEFEALADRLGGRVLELERALADAGAAAPIDAPVGAAAVDTSSLRFVGQPGARIAGRAGDALEALPNPNTGLDTPALGRGDLIILAVPFDDREPVLEALGRLLPRLRRV